MPTIDFQGPIGRINIPRGWQKPCRAAQWNDGVLVASTVGTYPVPGFSPTKYDDLPLALAPDGAGGVFVLSSCHVFFPYNRGPLNLRPVSATGKAAKEVRIGGDPSAWIGVLGVWCEAAVVPSGLGRCIVVWGEDQFVAGPVAQRFDQLGDPLWQGGNPVPLITPPGWYTFQNNFVAEPDGQDGAIVAWVEPARPVMSDVHNAQVQRIDANGNVLWGNNGIGAGSVKGTNTPYGQPWLQLVSDGNGGAIVVMPQESAGRMDYVAQRIGANGGLNGAPTLLVPSASAQEWLGFDVRIRRAVTDGAGGLFLAWSDANGHLKLVRYTSAGVVTPAVDVGRPTNPAAFCVHDDGRGGALVAWISSTLNRVELVRVDGNRSTTWDINTANAPTSVGLPPAAMNWTVDNWSHVAQAVPDNNGGAILVLQQWSVRGTVVSARLVTRCFDSSGIQVSPEQDVSARPGMQENPLVSPGGGVSAIVAWTDDNQANTLGLDAWAQRIGCCVPSPIGEQPFPRFGCELIQFSGQGFRDMQFSLPCGNRDRQWGVIPLTRFFASVRGLEYPGSVFNRDVDPPDWIRLRFSGLPTGTEVQSYSMKGELLAGTTPAASDAPCFLTFRPGAADDQLLVFSNSANAGGRPIHVDSEWGLGEPRPLPETRRFEPPR